MNDHIYDPPLGSIAYEGYRDFSQGVSLVSGQAIPPWPELPGNIQAAWNAAAQSVAAYLDRIPS